MIAALSLRASHGSLPALAAPQFFGADPGFFGGAAFAP